MNWFDVTTALVALQASVAITRPSNMQVRKAWPVGPPPDAALVDLPAWTNEFTFTGEDRDLSLRLQRGTYRMQLHIQQYQPTSDHRVAHAFVDAVIAAFDAHQKLTDAAGAQTIGVQAIRGGNPTVTRLERGGQAYLGIDLYLDVELNDAGVFAA